MLTVHVYFAEPSLDLRSSLIFFAGGAMNKARPAAMRRRRAILAVLCGCGIVASAALGFVAIPAILYAAQQ